MTRNKSDELLPAGRKSAVVNLRSPAKRPKLMAARAALDLFGGILGSSLTIGCLVMDELARNADERDEASTYREKFTLPDDLEANGMLVLSAPAPRSPGILGSTYTGRGYDGRAAGLVVDPETALIAVEEFEAA